VNSLENVKELRRRGDDISRDVRYWVRQYNHWLFGFEDDDSGETSVTFTAVSESMSDQLENLLVNCFQSCSEVNNDLIRSGAGHSLSTTRRLIKALGFTASTAHYGQMVRDVNREKRVAFCERLIQVMHIVLKYIISFAIIVHCILLACYLINDYPLWFCVKCIKMHSV